MKNKYDKTFTLAVQNHQKSNLKIAENLYKEILKTNPNHFGSIFYLGTLFMQTKRFDLAKPLLHKASQINPNYAPVHNNLGAALKELGGYQEAINCCQKAIQIDPNYADAHNNLGASFKELGEPQKAMDCYQKAIQIQPNHVDAYNNLGTVFRQLGKLQKAISCYEKAIQINPNYVVAYKNLGNILLALERFNDAIKIYQQALKLKIGDKFISHILSALHGNTTKTAPKEYVAELFDNFSINFDEYLTKKLKYRIPEKLVALLKKTTPERSNFKHAIDIGCGTGLSGLAFRPLTNYLVGIDISKEMIRKASDKNIYDHLEQENISIYLTKTSKKFDLFICTDVFIFVGDLDEVFSKISAKSNLNAKFCFSVEKCKNNEFKLLRSARYAHSKEYIDRLSKRYKFITEAFEETEIRFESNISITGYIFILKKI